ncbi:MAG: trypsin-like peptidase domain-containing protein [Thermoanaerobaculia bacterium]
MSPRAPIILAAIVLTLACNRRTPGLDEVQRTAYASKPAVVRVSAFATGEFRYTAEAIERVEQELGVARSGTAGQELAVETGAGGSGSGFLIHPSGYIVTSAHVVGRTRDQASLERDLRRNGAIAALVRHFSVETLRSAHRAGGLDPYVAPLAAGGSLHGVRVVNQVELSNGEVFPFRVRVYSPPLAERGKDLAILKIERRNLPSLALGDSDAVGVGESIWAVGYPALASSSDEVIGGWLSRDSDLEPTFNPGTITAIKVDLANTPVFQSNVAIYRGNSGGPAIDRRGAVVAVSTWGHTDAEQIKFLVPVNVVKELLGAASIPASPSGEFNRHYSKALDSATAGLWEDAVPELASAARVFPNSPDIARLRRDVERALKARPAVRTDVAVAALAALVLGATAILWFVRRRPRPEPAVLFPQQPAVELPKEPRLPGTLGRFTILNGDRAGEKLGLGGSGIRIGRESAVCEIVLDNPKVSRLHAEVVAIDGKVMLVDRNSSNGTYVNDQKIDKRVLRDGDIIYFGGRNAVAVAFHA